MANSSNHGGYREPEHPAGASGPGVLSQRTDGAAAGGQPQMIASGGGYGDRTEMESIQGGAEMAQAPGTPRPAGLLDPTARPDEPITAGADMGPGMGPQAAGIKSDFDITNDKLRPLVHSLEIIANLPQSNPETRAYVRALKARLADG